MGEELHFRISSALKDIIGRDLITDNYIAIFELVKNSFDAFATEVEVIFLNSKSSSPKIIIKDNGKGMSLEDLKNKWLFVAYSAKKEGTENDSFNYRDKIYKNRPFAGAKGIGRFSCDRLGKVLYLETTKKEKNSNTETLLTDWEKFEGDLKQEFVDITVIHEPISGSQFGLKHGTVLEISELRTAWNRDNLLQLKDSLAKLINPSKAEKESRFKITLSAPDEQDEDSSKSEYYDVVNGEIKNFIFDTLGLKTTKISTSISLNGEKITTELTDGNTLIYRIEEQNQFDLLRDIEFTLYYLNRAAKWNFAIQMGVPSVQYGHVFLYKNGFRIYPYGQPGEDPLGINLRKTQGVRRFLGTRELMGQIEIFSENDELKETSSRGDGLIRTPTYEQLIVCFWEVLKRLEKYVVDVQQWGLSIEDENAFSLRSRISELLSKLTGSERIIAFNVPENFLDVLTASQNESAESLIANLDKLAVEQGDQRLSTEIQKASNKLKELQSARIESEKESQLAFQKAKEATEKLKDQVTENLFLKSINSTEFQEVISLLHHIGIYAGTIDRNLKGILLRVQNKIQLSNEELHEIVRLLSFETKKILNIVSFATKANFRLKTEDIEVDLNDYIREYIQNIIPTTTDKRLKIEVKDLTDDKFTRKVKPIELNIIIDNLVSNARKASANKIEVTIHLSELGSLLVTFTDNGAGINEDNLKRIFDFGFTTTDGSGIGLYHVKEIVKSLGGSIKVLNNPDKGISFTIEFK
jgi:signal transduction histidine kinase